MTKRVYPCDGPEGICPYDAQSGMDCRDHCGLGCDDEYDPAEEASEPHDCETTCLSSSGHEYIRTPNHGWVCSICGAAMPDPPPIEPPPYDHP